MSRASRRDQAGFTLIELMVSLIAGLVVALAVVSLSKEATNTFHEESRTATAEMSLRTAVERLRNDLQRASYMSSPNIQGDPVIAHAPGSPNLPDKTTFPGLAKLAGIHLVQAGSLPLTKTLSSLNDNQNLTPDSIDLSGDFTSAEAFVVRALSDNGIGACAGQRLTLEMDSPAMWRVRGTPDPNATLAALFQPVAGAQFLVRIEDDTGHFQYVPTCSATATAQIVGAGPAMVAYVDVANNGGFHILRAAETQTNGGATGLGVGKLLVNPVQTVHWEVRPLDNANVSDRAYAPLNTTATAGNTKYDLFRTYVDASGNPTNQTELITEYAIDMKFAFSADLGGPTLNGLTVPVVTPRAMTIYGLSDVRNQPVADDVSAVITSTPQRIRSVRFRLSTRAAVADRTAGLIAPAANAQQPDYPLRYCVNPVGCTAGSEGWARVRTTTTEVALPNQAAVFW